MENTNHNEGPFSMTPSWTTDGKMQVRRPDGSPVLEVATPVNAQSILKALNEAYALGKRDAIATMPAPYGDMVPRMAEDGTADVANMQEERYLQGK